MNVLDKVQLPHLVLHWDQDYAIPGYRDASGYLVLAQHTNAGEFVFPGVAYAVFCVEALATTILTAERERDRVR